MRGQQEYDEVDANKTRTIMSRPRREEEWHAELKGPATVSQLRNVKRILNVGKNINVNCSLRRIPK